MKIEELSNDKKTAPDTAPLAVRARRPWRILVFLIVIAGLVSVIIYIKNEFSLETVTVSGCSYYTEDEIKEKILTGPVSGNVLWTYLINTVKEPSIPFVEKVDFEMINHHELLITVYEKSMVACIPYMNEYLYFDKDGIIIENSQKKMDYVPVIEGIQFSSMNLHEKPSVEDDDIFDTILNLSQLLKQYKIKTKSVYFNYKSEVILYSGDLKILLGKEERYDDKIAELSNVIKKAKNRNLKGKLDMRSFEAGHSEIIFTEEEI